VSRTSGFPLAPHLAKGQVRRYLAVGVFSTLFGYCTFALFTSILSRYIPGSYLVASLVASLLNITVAFLGYKWFVFRTPGNYLKEWARCLVVYSGSVALGLALLPPTVYLVGHVTDRPSGAPYIAGALVLILQVMISFLGHRTFTFGSPSDTPAAAQDASSAVGDRRSP